ncbi:hypothetical protein QZH41_004347 [Actinostola sp. cb2023]|nr:hypothetical protein QZH41_004347 [Actinostola sp. cb2023]
MSGDSGRKTCLRPISSTEPTFLLVSTEKQEALAATDFCSILIGLAKTIEGPELYRLAFATFGDHEWDLGAMEEKLNVKLKLLDLTRGKTKGVTETRNIDKIKRQKDLIEGVLKAVELLKIEVEESKLESGESIEEIQEWGQQIDEKIAFADDDMSTLSKCMKEYNTWEENERITKQEMISTRQRKKQLKFEKEKLEMKAKFGDAKDAVRKTFTDNPRVKLPKLSITPYDGKLENWLGFWNKFEAEVDQISMPTVTKFAYLKEMVEPKVLCAIDGLPFSTEGYERAKNILKSTYVPCALGYGINKYAYMSAFLVDLLKIKPKQTLTRSIKTIVGLVTKRVEIYIVEISDNDGNCVLPVSATKIDRKELLSLDNPNYPELLRRYPYLKGINMEETSVKPELPIHVILGANEYTKIKMAGYQRAGKMGEPVAEQTRFGWTIMTTGAEADLESMFLTQTAIGDYEELCRLDVLGLEDTPTGDQNMVHAEFVEQLQRSHTMEKMGEGNSPTCRVPKSTG